MNHNGKGRAWAPWEVELLKAVYADESIGYPGIALEEMLPNRTVSAIRQKANEVGVSGYRRKRHTRDSLIRGVVERKAAKCPNYGNSFVPA